MKFRIPLVKSLTKIALKTVKISAKIAIRAYGLEDEVEDLKNIVTTELDKIKKNDKDTAPKRKKGKK